MPAPRPARTSTGILLLALAPLTLFGACTQEPSPPQTATPTAPVAVPERASVRAELPVESPARTIAAAPGVVPPPPVPGSLRVTTQSPSEVAIAWQPSASAEWSLTYELFRDAVRVLRTAETRALDGNLKPGTRYCYAVRAVDPAGRASAPCASVCTQTLDTIAPTPPPGVTAVSRPGNVAELSWSPSTDDVGVTGYEVFRAEARVASVGGTFAREERLTPGKEYCWKVTARRRRREPVGRLRPGLRHDPRHDPADGAGPGDGERLRGALVDLAWEASQDDVGVVRYEIQRAGAPVLASTGTARVSEGSLRPGATASRCAPATRPATARRPLPRRAPRPPTSRRPPAPRPSPPSPAATWPSSSTWAASTDEVGVVGYEVKRGDKVLAASHPGLAFDGGRAAPGNQVLLFGAGPRRGREPVGAKRACATTLDLTPPTRPGRPAAVSVSSSQLFLGWDPSTDDVGVAGYEVLRDGAVIATVAVTRMREHNLPANVGGLLHGARVRRLRQPLRARRARLRQDRRSLPARVAVRSARGASLLARRCCSSGSPPSRKASSTASTRTARRVVGLTRWNTFNPSGRMGARADCYRVAAVDDQSRESPPSNEVCTAATTGVVTQR